MIGKLTAVLAFSLAWLAAPAVWADPGSGQRECCDYNGFYAGIGGGIAVESFDGGSSDNSAVSDMRVGYRFLDFLAIEGEGEYMWNYNGNSGRYTNGDTSIWAGWLNGKVYPLAPWTGFIQPYGLAGVGAMWADVKNTTAPGVPLDAHNIGWHFGGGIDFFLTEHIFLTTDAVYVLPTGSLKRLEQVVVGGAISYRF